MGLHKNRYLVLRESLPELVFAAEQCIKNEELYRKHKENGCLGFPGTILLFVIIDSIGSFHVGGKFNVGGISKKIKGGYTHFYILNSKYFGNQNMKENPIKYLYQHYRNILIHNAVIPDHHPIDIGDEGEEPFFLGKDNKGKISVAKINLIPLLELCKKAVPEFLDECENLVLDSAQESRIKKKNADRTFTLRAVNATDASATGCIFKKDT